jgi:DNA-binding XRE family transcriptional regulator
MTSKPIDINKVEALRNHMMLTVADMARAVGVSRVTYHSWINGKRLRKENEEALKRLIRQLITVMHEHQWPGAEVEKLGPRARSARLLALLGKH